MKNSIRNVDYIGRFAPSPSGALHFGSLVTAIGSYLQAKSQSGKWLLRIEDIDPPREVFGSTDKIMRCLEAHHLCWDGQVTYQSDRSELYNEKIQWLAERNFTFCCQCTRAQLNASCAKKLCLCADKKLSTENAAVRFRYKQTIKQFNDELLGQIEFDNDKAPAQFAVKRKDGLFAYQLAVVVDDIEQGITEVARGADLLDATFFQLALYQAFECAAPTFLHFPVVVTEPGVKLSKQNHAAEVSANYVKANIINALAFLELTVPTELTTDSSQNILNWAIQAWDVNKIPAKTERIDNRIGQTYSI